MGGLTSVNTARPTQIGQLAELSKVHPANGAPQAHCRIVGYSIAIHHHRTVAKAGPRMECPNGPCTATRQRCARHNGALGFEARKGQATVFGRYSTVIYQRHLLSRADDISCSVSNQSGMIYQMTTIRWIYSF
jgi:hypothetical protein